ncbi:hypothetical protein E4U24_006670 [Claviceps purpurea]|nr:hypothetical protein E4U24_006670 [Claviceps purpurea]
MGMSPESTDKSKSLLPRPAVITQAFAAMVREGIRYGIIFAACDPSSDVDGDDDKMDFSAVPRLTALCVYGSAHEGSRSFINVESCTATPRHVT